MIEKLWSNSSQNKCLMRQINFIEQIIRKDDRNDIYGDNLEGKGTMNYPYTSDIETIILDIL